MLGYEESTMFRWVHVVQPSNSVIRVKDDLLAMSKVCLVSLFLVGIVKFWWWRINVSEKKVKAAMCVQVFCLCMTCLNIFCFNSFYILWLQHAHTDIFAMHYGNVCYYMENRALMKDYNTGLMFGTPFFSLIKQMWVTVKVMKVEHT